MVKMHKCELDRNWCAHSSMLIASMGNAEQFGVHVHWMRRHIANTIACIWIVLRSLLRQFECLHYELALTHSLSCSHTDSHSQLDGMQDTPVCLSISEDVKCKNNNPNHESLLAFIRKSWIVSLYLLIMLLFVSAELRKINRKCSEFAIFKKLLKRSRFVHFNFHAIFNRNTFLFCPPPGTGWRTARFNTRRTGEQSTIKSHKQNQINAKRRAEKYYVRTKSFISWTAHKSL